MTKHPLRTIQKIFLTATVSVAAVVLSARPAAGTFVDLAFFNTYAVSNFNGSAALQGNTNSGDLVQLILAGANGTNDAPGTTGGAGGDDTVLFTTHIGVGMLPVDYNAGLLDAYPVALNLTVGTNLFVRFWNAPTTLGATYYGDSMLLQFPYPDAFDYGELDFVPLSSSPHETDQSWTQVSAIPEPTGVFLFGLAVVTLGRRIFRPQKSSSLL